MSWRQLIDIGKEAAAEREFNDSAPPVACPKCGEPLLPGPPSAAATLYCKFDGWEYPRDWQRPQGR